MDVLFGLILMLVGFQVLKRSEERQRILLLGGFLRKYQLEPRMAQLTDGYLRALGESDPERADPIWRMLAGTEAALQQELSQLANDLKDVWGERLRVSRWPVGVPMATRFFPQASFDFRALVLLHAQALERVLRNDEGLSRKDCAFRTTAELLLFQHSCHWFCRSRAVASARLLALHKTAYAQVLAGVSPATRDAYRALTGV
ncbi:hypothetical protein [Hydrogenophaga sp. NFH-34]|uniref:hypothetical protein n=1 Tax=Hydrogenophaga sp. NFH-34 TaxID=2744446 RepID=UPI001F3B43B8|nr:hypothetical protein [Hydrogenophaga sp. NFH-34]